MTFDAKIFFAPTSLRAGGFWLPELAKGITEADAFLLLVGPKGLGPWQVIEYYEAYDRRVKEHDFPIVLVLLEGQPAPGLPFLRQLHWIITPDPASEQSVAKIMDATAGGDMPAGQLWRHTAPYRGLAAMKEEDSDYFFGRGRETVEVIRALEAAPDKLPIVVGNSGVGKSSLVQAGVLAALRRQAWPETAEAPGSWPRAFDNSRTWCVITLRPGTEPVRALVEPFLRTWQLDAVDPRRAELLESWAQRLTAGTVGLRDLLDATELRYRDQLHQPQPPAFLLYIDQGEELYVRAEPQRGRRFSQILAVGLNDPRLRALMSLRADFFGELQKDEALDDVSRKVEVKPLREAQLREVVSKPAVLLGARFEPERLAAEIALRAAEESTKDVGALPLLSYLLDDMWKSKDSKWDGILRLSLPAIELGGVLVDRANAFMAEHPLAEDTLRRIFTLKLATVREDGEPTRRRAFRYEFSAEEWRLVSELADHPNRLLVTATVDTAVTPASDVAQENEDVTQAIGEMTYAEVAHETIFRRWDKLREWIAAEREFLAWRSGLETARRSWQGVADASKHHALLMGFALTQARSWLAKRSGDISEIDRAFITQSRKAMQRRVLRMQVLAGVFVAAIVAGFTAWWQEDWLKERMYALANVTSLKSAQEHALKAGDSFKECTDCPEMIVVPAGNFIMGSPSDEKGRYTNEGPQHKVTIAKPIAVSKFELMFAEWDACATYGDCDRHIDDSGWGRDQQPVINVNWYDAKRYVAWISRITGNEYRLLSESEYEYSARAGSSTAFPWGDEIGKDHANCGACGSGWDNKRPAPVGSFNPNAFGLYDMVGNIWEWVEDCEHENYLHAPSDGSPWTSDGLPNAGIGCDNRMMHGGSWNDFPRDIRSARRFGGTTGGKYKILGFRVGRSLSLGGGVP